MGSIGSAFMIPIKHPVDYGQLMINWITNMWQKQMKWLAIALPSGFFIAPFLHQNGQVDSVETMGSGSEM
jgi:hypothetical protein